MNSKDDRSTRTRQRSCDAVANGEVGTTVQTTCQCAGQLNVNQRAVWFAATVLENCVPAKVDVWVAEAINWRRFGRLPIRCVAGRPGSSCCGDPVARSNARARAGDSGMRPRARSTPCTHASAPVTIGEALEVPLNVSVYQTLEFAPPWRSP